MLPFNRSALAIVAITALVAAAWLLLFAVPDLLDRHSDGALALALGLVVSVPSGLAWGAIRLWHLLAPEDDGDG
ncbi:hypothetical protein [Polymorphobacter megasporae]|uniref:hypothetical protein n=1 Tax=Glacieibacterium megasporae TaxID=2835787 RepID=UPI001C1E8898|nr:hypothetical protein [Polymorphobacter megasporae]UAJ11215.1 hypothetical protein KTC28_05780 [Polymorphobacter megasporae]